MNPESGTAYIGLSAPREGYDIILQCSSPEEYARKLFSFFRNCDHSGIRVIHCEMPPETGIGRAIIDRLTRAAIHH